MFLSHLLGAAVLLALAAPAADAAPDVTTPLPGTRGGTADGAQPAARPAAQPGAGPDAGTASVAGTRADPPSRSRSGPVPGPDGSPDGIADGTGEAQPGTADTGSEQPAGTRIDETGAGDTAVGDAGAGDTGAGDAGASDTGATGAVTAASGAAADTDTDRFDGWGFDTCVTPSLATMRAWNSSKYRSIGVYYGGRGRGCPNQPELTKSWVSSVYGMGWKVLPVFVGSQSPCVSADSKRKVTIGSDPAGEGADEGRDAVERAKALGMVAGSPLYLDMEAYAQDDRDCAATTLSFIRSWDREVERLGYVSGFYSSADSGVEQIGAERRAGTSDLPSVMWFARWNDKPSVTGEPSLRSQDWSPHLRIHQYAGDVKEEHGGEQLSIDRNRVDAPVARIAD